MGLTLHLISVFRAPVIRELRSTPRGCVGQHAAAASWHRTEDGAALAMLPYVQALHFPPCSFWEKESIFLAEDQPGCSHCSLKTYSLLFPSKKQILPLSCRWTVGRAHGNSQVWESITQQGCRGGGGGSASHIVQSYCPPSL